MKRLFAVVAAQQISAIKTHETVIIVCPLKQWLGSLHFCFLILDLSLLARGTLPTVGSKLQRRI